jgi:HD-like signal output (HDOD) protein
MTDKTLAQLIDARFDADSEQLPVFNRVALELQRVKESETATMDQVTQLIMKDQALTSRILRVANSPFYAALREIDTLSGAVLRLGINKVASLAMMAAQVAAYQSKSEATTQRMARLWQRAYVCASGARWIAENTGKRAEAENVFLASLLHDIGELFLLKVMDQLTGDPSVPGEISDHLIDDVLESMHNQIGYRLMLKWELPERYALIARDHHRQAIDETDFVMATTRLMDLVCLKIGVGQEARPEMVLPATLEADITGLSELQLAQLEVLIEDLVAEADALR